MIDIKDLPKPAKVEATKTLDELGFSIRKTAEILGVSERSVSRYKNAELDNEWHEFGETIKKVFLEYDFELAHLAYEKIKEKIDTARFFELVGLYKTARDLQQPKNQGVPQLVNVGSSPMEIEFISDELEEKDENEKNE